MLKGVSLYKYKNVSITDRLHIGNRWLGHLGLAMYDNTARVHDPVMPHFLTVDALATKNPNHSPFCHCAGNSIMFIDLSGKEEWPVDETYRGQIRSHNNDYNEKRGSGRFHKGVDINMKGSGNSDWGAPVFATHDGTIIKAVTQDQSPNPGGTRITILSVTEMIETVYMHLDSFAEGISQDVKVKEGQLIGFMGNTGGNYPVHLHYGIKENGAFIDPTNGKDHLKDAQQLDNKYRAKLQEVVVTAVGQSKTDNNLSNIRITIPQIVKPVNLEK